MSKFVSVFCALSLNLAGIFIFREPKVAGAGPVLSCYIFEAAVFMLLCDLSLHPKSLKKLPDGAQCFLEFWLCLLIFELAIVDFWLPMEAAVLAFLPKLAAYEEELLQRGGWTCDGICQFFAWEGTGVFFSYLLSMYFMVAVLHATGVIDLRLLKYSPRCFFTQTFQQFGNLKKRLWCMLGGGAQHGLSRGPSSSHKKCGEKNKKRFRNGESCGKRCSSRHGTNETEYECEDSNRYMRESSPSNDYSDSELEIDAYETADRRGTGCDYDDSDGYYYKM